MINIHQLVFYLLVIFVLIFNAINGYSFFYNLVTGKIRKAITQGVEEDKKDSFPDIPGAITIDLMPIIILVILAAIYFQAKSFNSPVLIHTVITFCLIDILNLIFKKLSWPTSKNPDRPVTISLITFSSIFSLSKFALLILMLIQPFQIQ